MRIATVTSFAGLVLTAFPALAVTIDPAAPLPQASSYESIGVGGNQDNLRTSTTIGTLDYTGGYICAGTCQARTALGASPSVEVVGGQAPNMFYGGGSSRADLVYYVRYDNPINGLFDVTIHSVDVMSILGGSTGQAYLGFGTPNNPGSYVIGDPIVNDIHCVGGCSALPLPANLHQVSSLGDYVVQMQSNTPYLVRLFVNIDHYPDGLTNSVMIDPTFSTAAQGGSFSFSDGVFADVPEPASWALMLTGFGAIGAALRRRTAPALARG